MSAEPFKLEESVRPTLLGDVVPELDYVLTSRVLVEPAPPPPASPQAG